jgi:hypothetical protein
VESGAPQLGHAAALSETSFPHSEHLISAIVLFSSFLRHPKKFSGDSKRCFIRPFYTAMALFEVKSDQVRTRA